MSALSWGKTHRSALVIIPPEPIWPTLQTLRKKYDRQFDRWMPHINLLYPFVAEEHYAEAARLLEEALRSVPAFAIRLGQFRWFEHASGSATIWLQPEPSEAVQGLQAVVQKLFPHCDDVRRFPQGYTPHLSVGQSVASGVAAFVARLQAAWNPLEFIVEELAMIARPDNGPFTVRRTVQLAHPRQHLAGDAALSC